MRRASAYLFVPALALLPQLAVAADKAALPIPDLVGSGLRMLLSLVLVVALIIAAGWLGRRMQRRGGADARSLRALASVHVGQRERVVLIQAGATQLLVGVAPGQVRALHVLDTPIAVGEAAHAPGASFAEALRQLARRGAQS
jgi:flagellar protein FliO/FliZ